MLKNNVISHNRKNFINLNLYRNILILCFKLNEKEKLKKFIRESSREILIFLVKAVNELISLNFNYDEYKLFSLKKKVKASMKVPGSDWITNKIEELSRKNKN